MAATPVLLYDGICGFCNGAVQTILRLDRDGDLRFAALDSEFGKAVITRHPHLADVDSVVFVDDPGGPAERVTVIGCGAAGGEVPRGAVARPAGRGGDPDAGAGPAVRRSRPCPIPHLRHPRHLPHPGAGGAGSLLVLSAPSSTVVA
ncbi:thiol-disulfide oxidoreductase [Mycolicibacterium aurum]|uniref:Thiol-disulfide oxidoreductase n=1 Tax=Mycolicibacterium aurum TaxID=1791 RepID=A0A3S4RSA2_MYCAU|nr:thiol-disulfide oxidoreductase [Mycolicibacterium aurum]